jgi:hypothetical protein
VNPNSDLYPVTLSPTKGRSQNGWFPLAFQGEEGLHPVVQLDTTRLLTLVLDLFEFQEWMTGYKVVDDLSGSSVLLSLFARADW